VSFLQKYRRGGVNCFLRVNQIYDKMSLICQFGIRLPEGLVLTVFNNSHSQHIFPDLSACKRICRI
ncbi:MAG: hypothetical protein ACOCY3_01110, partial [Desulfosalsimonas sp.]